MLAGCGGHETERPQPAQTFAVSRVVDGDTIRLANGERVRLVQIDAPELAQGECYAKQAKTALERMLPTRVRLEFDPKLDHVDRFGRQLAYVFAEQTNVNVALVRRGAASVWFYHGARGKYAGRLLWAARQAQEDGFGLWLACGATRFDPLHQVATEPGLPPPRRPTAQPEG